MFVFYFVAAIVIGLGVLSLLNGLKFASYVRRELARPLQDYAPFASVIAPTRGLEQGLVENVASLFNQAYPEYEIIFVTDSEDDPSLDVIREVIRTQNEPGVSARIVIAGEAGGSGQKVHNLRVAVPEIDPRSEILVFVDTDARPQANWLKSLVAPLANNQVGAATGYRWFVSVDGGFASQLRSVWNSSIASALGERGDKNFCWGGSTAIRRSTFDELKIKESWRGTVSDDFAMTRVLHEARIAVHFVPACLVPSLDSCNFRELFEFTNRQLRITRVYASHLWKPVLIGSLLFTSVFFGGLVLVIARAILRLNITIPLTILLIIYAMGAAKSYVRLKAVMIPLESHRKELWRSLPAHLFLWPVASALYFWNALVAAFSRRIKWRGITYELKSATEAVIIRRK
jgi:ceramide glucosyltransferase